MRLASRALTKPSHPDLILALWQVLLPMVPARGRASLNPNNCHARFDPPGARTLRLPFQAYSFGSLWIFKLLWVSFAAFDAIYPALAARHNISLYPFVLRGVFGVRRLMQSDGEHPNVLGVQRMVAGILPLVEKNLSNRRRLYSMTHGSR